MAEQTTRLREAQPLLKGITDEPSAAAAKPNLTDLRRQLTELFDQEKQLGAWSHPDMKAVNARNAAAMSVVGEWTRLLRLRGAVGDIRAITDDWDGLLTQLKESLRTSAGK